MLMDAPPKDLPIEDGCALHSSIGSTGVEGAAEGAIEGAGVDGAIEGATDHACEGTGARLGLGSFFTTTSTFGRNKHAKIPLSVVASLARTGCQSRGEFAALDAFAEKLAVSGAAASACCGSTAGSFFSGAFFSGFFFAGSFLSGPFLSGFFIAGPAGCLCLCYCP